MKPEDEWKQPSAHYLEASAQSFDIPSCALSLELSRDGRKTWEVVGHSPVVLHPFGELVPEERYGPVIWVGLEGFSASIGLRDVVKMTTPS